MQQLLLLPTARSRRVGGDEEKQEERRHRRRQGIEDDPDRNEWLAAEGGTRGGIKQKLPRVR